MAHAISCDKPYRPNSAALLLNYSTTAPYVIYHIQSVCQPNIPSVEWKSEYYFVLSLDCRLDVQKFPSWNYEAVVASSQQYADVCCAGEPHHLTIGLAVGCEWPAVISIVFRNMTPYRSFCLATWTSRAGTSLRSQKTATMTFRVESVCVNYRDGDRERCHCRQWRLLLRWNALPKYYPLW